MMNIYSCRCKRMMREQQEIFALFRRSWHLLRSREARRDIDGMRKTLSMILAGDIGGTNTRPAR